jgi:hypothetical protein
MRCELLLRSLKNLSPSYKPNAVHPWRFFFAIYMHIPKERERQFRAVKGRIEDFTFIIGIRT